MWPALHERVKKCEVLPKFNTSEGAHCGGTDRGRLRRIAVIEIERISDDGIRLDFDVVVREGADAIRVVTT